MKTINYGDVWTLKTPLEGLTNDELKSLSYMMGSLSNRPVVVIRPPAKWDRFGQVTVIPSVSKMGPAYHVDCEDMYGNNESRGYNWYAQNPYTIPVKRLNYKIGSLDIQELKQLLYTVHWLHDPFMQADPNNPVPAGYEDATLEQYIVHRTTDTKPNLIRINSEYRVIRSTEPSLEGKQLIPSANACNGDFRNRIETIHYCATHPTSKPKAMDNHEQPKSPVEKDKCVKPNDTHVIVNMLKRYDVSHPAEIADLVATERLRIQESDLQLAQKRTIRRRFVLGNTVDEKVLKVKYNNEVIDKCWKMYDGCTGTDIYTIIPKMMTHDVSRIYKVHLAVASVFKKLCVLARDLTNDDYNAQRNEYVKKYGAEFEFNPDDVKPTEPEYTEYTLELFSDQDMINSKLLELEKYLTQERMSQISDPEVMKDFLRIPIYEVKAAYHGNAFMKVYSHASNKYKRILAKLNK